MNRRQITFLWVVLTLLCPSAYLVIEFLVKEHTYTVTNAKGEVYRLKTDDTNLTDQFIERQILRGNLKPLSSREIEALDSYEDLREERIRVMKFSVIGLFVVGSFTGLYLYRMRSY